MELVPGLQPLGEQPGVDAPGQLAEHLRQRQPDRALLGVGRARRLTPAEADRLPADAGPTPWLAGPRRHLLSIEPERVTGRWLR